MPQKVNKNKIESKFWVKGDGSEQTIVITYCTAINNCGT